MTQAQTGAVRATGEAGMTPDRFAELAAGGCTHVPVYRDVMADFDTPLSVYRKLAAKPYSYLLESAQGGEKWGRYSLVGLATEQVIRICGERIAIERAGLAPVHHQARDPLAFIASFLARYRVPDLPELPRFSGGLVGYFGYDTVRYVEPRLRASTPPDSLQVPDILLMVSNEVVVFDNLRSRATLICLVDVARPDAYLHATRRLGELEAALAQPMPAIPRPATRRHVQESDFQSAMGAEKFMQAVERIKEYTLTGDIMQVVLAQRMSLRTAVPAIDLYRALRTLNPSPYMYFMDLKDFQIVSCSPEILARLEDGVVTSRPLAGTRRRGRTEEEDLVMEAELREDPKEIAEHLMLIDLARNDVSRVAVAGSVRVTEKMNIERYSHVMHISSTVIGKMQPGGRAIDLLRATLPVGTLSGAPKIRAMEIIDELEPTKRGIYGGAVGYLAWNGNMDTAIAIRTAVVKDGTIYLQVGGGVVADSIPSLEWKESLNKGRAIFRAAALAESGFAL